MSEYICHHGIKGQRWGHRRFQNADGSLTVAGRRRYSQAALPPGRGPGEYVDAEGRTVGYNDRGTAKGSYRVTRDSDSRKKSENSSEKYRVKSDSSRDETKSKNRQADETQSSDRQQDVQPQTGNRESPELALARSATGVLSSYQKRHAEKTKQHEKQKLPMDLSNLTNKDLQDAITRYDLEEKYTDRFAPRAVTEGEKKVDKFLARASNVANTGLAVYELMDKIGAIDAAKKASKKKK